MWKEIKYLVVKEVTMEWRQKYAVGGLLLYVTSAVFISYLSFKKIVSPPAWNALFWIILLFASVNAVSKSFMNESKGRLLYTYSLVSPQALIIAKMAYNMLLMLLLSLVCYFFYGRLIGDVVQDVPLFILCLISGSIGLAAVLTMVSAIVSKTNSNFTLMAILSFPVVSPLLITLIRLSKNAIDGLAWSVSYPYLLVVLFIDVIVGILTYILFPYLWKD